MVDIIGPNVVPGLIIEVFMVELAIIVGDMLDNMIGSDDIIVSVIMVSDIMVSDIVMADGIMAVDIFVEDVIMVDVFVEDIMMVDGFVDDIMLVDVNWLDENAFDDGRTKPPMPAAARALRVETIMAMLRMLDFDLKECSVVKS